MDRPGTAKTTHVPMTSADEVRRLAGPLTDDAVAEILRVGPSLEELQAAVHYVHGEGDLVDRAGYPLAGRTAQVYEILGAEEEGEEEYAQPPA